MEKSIMEIDSWFKNKAGIYKLSIANHVYIGSSISLWSRLKQHRTDLKNNRHINQYLQRAVNKYGFENLKYEVLILFGQIKLKTLREFEKEYINHFHADLNLKLDPITENNCISTSKKVYQYDLGGNFIKEWESCNEAARNYKIHSSGINVSCIRPERQHKCAGFLWSYEYPYPYKQYITKIYCFDLSGKYINCYNSTTEIANALFPDIDIKTVLSQLKKKIDTKIPYKNIYLSSSRKFSINANYKPKYKAFDETEIALSGNPIIYIYNRSNQLIGTKRLLDFDKPIYVRHKIRKGCCTYRLEQSDYYIKGRKKIEAFNLLSGERQIFVSAVSAANILFGNKKLGKNILKHISRNTSYKNYSFKRVL